MENQYHDVIEFMKNRKVNSLTRLYVDRNARKEYLTYIAYKKTKNDFEATLVQRNNRIGTSLCNFLNCNFKDLQSVKNFVEEYSFTLLYEITKMEFKNTYSLKEYETMIQEIVNKSGDKLENIKEDFIHDINYLFNVDQLEEIKELTPLQRFYVLSKKENKAISQFENSKLQIALGDLTKLIDNTSTLDEESLIEVATVNKDRILCLYHILLKAKILVNY